MKRFLIRLLIYLSIASAFLAFEELTFRKIPNDYSVKYEYLEKNASKVQILILGSSLELQGVNASIFHSHAFNAAIYAQSPEFDKKYFDRFFPDMDSLQVLILPFSYFSLRYRDIPYPISLFEFNQKCHFHASYMRPRDHFAISSYLPPRTHRCVKRYLLLGENLISIDSLGWRHASENYGNISAVEKEMQALQYANDNIDKCGGNIAINRARYDDMISRCNQRGVRVILLSCPKTEAYFQYVDPLVVDSVISEGYAFERQYPNVTYINLFHDTRFPDSLFANANHLNAQGAEKLTLILDSIIENHLLVQQP